MEVVAWPVTRKGSLSILSSSVQRRRPQEEQDE
jgi:hypothetical protein